MVFHIMILRKRYKKKCFNFFHVKSPLMDSKKQLDVIEFLEKFCIKNNLILFIRPHPGIKHVGLDKYKKRKK